MSLFAKSKDRLIQLADRAIEIAEAEKVSAQAKGLTWMVEDCQTAIRNFTSIREQAVAGTLPMSNGAGLGITRALSEWQAPEPLYAAGRDLEKFYQSQFNA